MTTEQLVEPVFQCNGDIVQLYEWLDYPERAPTEVLFEGQPGAAKTRNILEWIRHTLDRYPGTKVLFVRETRESVTDSILPIWEEEVLGLDHPALGGAQRENRSRYRSPKGWEVVLGGLNKPRKLFSTQWDIIYFCEIQETTLRKWMYFARSQRQRGKVKGVKESNLARIPFRLRIGDCNPEDEFHWANQRACGGGDHGGERCPGKMHRLRGKVWDNPLYFCRDLMEWTKAGKEYVSQLVRSLKGTILYDRLVLGLWRSTSGMVWGDWSPQDHVITGELDIDENGDFVLLSPDMPCAADGTMIPRRMEYFVGGHDIGFNAPGCAHVWGFDSDGRGYLIAEAYLRETPTDAPKGSGLSWCDVWEFFWDEYEPAKIVTDHDPDFMKQVRTRLRLRAKDVRFGRWSKKRDSKTREKTGIDVVRRYMKPRGDGTFGFYVLNSSRLHPYGIDEDRKSQGLPTGLTSEVTAWAYPDEDERKNSQEPEPNKLCQDHACDVTRGVFHWNDYKDLTPERKKRFEEGTYGRRLGNLGALPDWLQ